LVEGTGNIAFGLPLMFVLMVAKWVADYFNEGLYDMHIEMHGVPFLPWNPPPASRTITARNIMSENIITMSPIESVERIENILKKEKHNGFPVVWNTVDQDGDSNFCGTFCGLILRSQLIIVLQNKLFLETKDVWDFKNVGLEMFREAYPRYPTIEQVHISPVERQFTVDLAPYMNPTPYTVHEMTSLPRVFWLFRALGLRHLVVVNNRYQPIGMVTRKDLAKYRVWNERGQMGITELTISNRS